MNHVQDHLQQEARACYKRKDFTKALALFDRAIGRAASVQLLDNRAACHDKLGDLPAALKDAKKAIQLQREDPTGYLRAGKVLTKMGKQSVALEIYSHGLRSVKHVGEGFKLLRKTHGELSAQLSPPKSVDPLTVLPRELAEVILEYLTFRQRINACLVSKQWVQFIRSAPLLWEHLNLTGARRKVSNKFISRAINVGRKRLTMATLTNMYDVDKSLTALLQHCPIERLTLLDTGLQSHNLLAALSRAKSLKYLHVGRGTQVGVSTLAGITSGLAATLESLECQVYASVTSLFGVPCPKLTTLIIHGVRLYGGEALLLDNVRRFATNLQLLAIPDFWTGNEVAYEDFCPLKRLECLEFRTKCPTLGLFEIPPTVKTLLLSSGGGGVWNFWEHRQVSGYDPEFVLPALTDLYVNIPHIDRIMPFLARDKDANDQSTSKLRRFALGKDVLRIKEGDFDLFVAHPRVRDLEVLELHMPECCTDHDIDLVCNTLKKLRSVDVSGTAIDGYGVRQLVEKAGVRHLVLNDCRKLGRDAVQWARDQGVCVEARNAETVSGARKVRY